MTGQRPAAPVTHHVNVENALATLSCAQMLALAKMFERWALTETNIDGEQRTKLVQWSADYEAIAAHAGPDWTPHNPAGTSLLAFIAGQELTTRGNDNGAGEP